MDVQHIMTKSVITAGPDQSVRDALQILEDADIRHLPIVSDGKLVGVVSDRDLREYRAPLFEASTHPRATQRLLSTRLGDVMKPQVLSLDTGESLRAAVDVMIEYRVGALPVIDRETAELVGIVSYVDILEALRPGLDVE